MTMGRVYVPSTLSALREVRDGRPLAVPAAYSVTDRLRAQLALPDAGAQVDEELAEAALVAAADAGLELLADDPACPRRRVVVAVDAPVRPGGPDSHPAAVVCSGPVGRSDIASILVDDDAAVPAVTAAVDALGRGDEDGYEAALERLDDHALSWFDVSELDDLAAAGDRP
jgi:hypothetical protein